MLSLAMVSSLFWMCSKDKDEAVLTGSAVKGAVVNADVPV